MDLIWKFKINVKLDQFYGNPIIASKTVAVKVALADSCNYYSAVNSQRNINDDDNNVDDIHFCAIHIL